MISDILKYSNKVLGDPFQIFMDSDLTNQRECSLVDKEIESH